MIMNLWQGSSKRAGQLSFVDTGRGQAGGATWSDGKEKACKPQSYVCPKLRTTHHPFDQRG